MAAWITRCASRPERPEPSILAGLIAARDLRKEAGDAVAERIVKIGEAAEHGVGIYFLHQVAGGIERGFAPHILEYQPAFAPRHFAALHGMAAGDVVARGKVAHRAAGELHVDGSGGIDIPAAGDHRVAMHFFDVAHEIAHDVHAVRVERLQVIIGRIQRLRLADPQRHVAEQELANAPIILPFFGRAGRGRKAVVHIDAIAHAHFFRQIHHFLRVAQVVADGLFAQHVTARAQRLHGGFVVVGTVFVATGGDGNHVGLFAIQHFLRVVIRGHAQRLGGGVRPLMIPGSQTATSSLTVCSLWMRACRFPIWPMPITAERNIVFMPPNVVIFCFRPAVSPRRRCRRCTCCRRPPART